MLLVAALGFGVLARGRHAAADESNRHGLRRCGVATREIVRTCLERASLAGVHPKRARKTLQLLERIQTRAGKTILLPEDCFVGEQTFDLIVHFHGVHTALEPALSVSGLRAAMLITIDGIGAEAYSTKYQFEYSLPALVEGAEKSIAAHCGNGARSARRIALSAWSAGYGAISRILRWPEHFRRVDAVLLADGLHAPYAGDGSLNAPSLKHFLAFGRRAAAGKALFGLTHSSIETIGYASTTETADYLLRSLSVMRTLEDTPGPRPGMRRKYHADTGALHVAGYGGVDPAAHAAHQHAMGQTLLPLLATHWRQSSSPPRAPR